MLPNVDHPETFGQHPNADIASQIIETRWFRSKCFDCAMSVTNCLLFFFICLFLVLICCAFFVALLSDLYIFVFTKDRFSVIFHYRSLSSYFFVLCCFFFSGICLVRYFLFNPRSLLLEDKERAGRKRLVALKENLKKKSGGKLNSAFGLIVVKPKSK